MTCASSSIRKNTCRLPWKASRKAAHHALLDYGKSFIACALLLSFLNTIFLPSTYKKLAQSKDTRTSILCSEDHPETLLTYLVDCCIELPETLPDEESDFSDAFKFAKEFMGLAYQTPHFSRAFLSEFSFAEVTMHWTGFPLQCFSPPPER